MRPRVIKISLIFLTFVFILFLILYQTYQEVYLKSKLGLQSGISREFKTPAQVPRQKKTLRHFDCVGRSARSYDRGFTATYKTPHFGRSGNKIIAAQSLIFYAVEHGCDINVPADLLEGWSPACTFFHNRNVEDVTSQVTKRNCNISKNGRDWFFFSRERRESALQVSLDVLSQYFLTNETHAYGKLCTVQPRLSFHIRGGDIVRGDFISSGSYVPKFVHPKYGPVPTSFYAAVLASQKEFLGKDFHTVATNQIVIFSEDIRNPSLEFFLKLRIIGYNITLRIGLSLLEDLHLMSCSENVAISYGSFWKAFSLRESTKLHIFTKGCENESEYFYPSSAKYYAILKGTERSKFAKGMKVWKNTAYQRHLVDKFYQISACTR